MASAGLVRPVTEGSSAGVESRKLRGGQAHLVTHLFVAGDGQAGRGPELAQLVRCGIAVDAVEGFLEVGGQRVGGGDDVITGLDLDSAVAAGGPDELPD